jgi:hypothetical protein
VEVRTCLQKSRFCHPVCRLVWNNAYVLVFSTVNCWNYPKIEESVFTFANMYLHELLETLANVLSFMVRKLHSKQDVPRLRR